MTKPSLDKEGSLANEPESRRRLVCIADIPAPYRLHLFNALDDELRKRDIDFEVMFLGQRSPMRDWTVDLRKARFEYSIARGWHPRWGYQIFHVNPGALRAQLARPPTWLL